VKNFARRRRPVVVGPASVLLGRLSLVESRRPGVEMIVVLPVRASLLKEVLRQFIADQERRPKTLEVVSC